MRTFRNLCCIRHWNGASLAKRLYLKHAGENMCTSPFTKLRDSSLSRCPCILKDASQMEKGCDKEKD